MSAAAAERALSATELQAVTTALQSEAGGMRVDDLARLNARDDLLLFLSRQSSDGEPSTKRALHIALGARRARISTTRRRFSKHEFATGPLVDRLRERFVGRTVVGIEQPTEGERYVQMRFSERETPEGGSGVDSAADSGSKSHAGRQDHTATTLEVELFGNRGLWTLCDAETAEILELSRLPNSAGRTLRPGAQYAPPAASPQRPQSIEQTTPRFQLDAAPELLLKQVDEHFTAHDRAEEQATETTRVRNVLKRALNRAEQRAQGLERQLASMDRAHELRRDADLLLAYGFGLAKDATELRAPHPDTPDEVVVIQRDPSLPVHVQAEKLYQKARKYEDGRTHAEQQVLTAVTERDALAELTTNLAKDSDGAALNAVRAALVGRGLLAPHPAEHAKKKPKQKADRASREAAKEGYRRFTSCEGLPIFVGRNNAQNDRLSIRYARGNDLWFHVGAGYAGSHVVIRLDKNRTDAGLESLLDAGTLAVHYSKVRGADICEVIYTRAKHVTKPKGLPPGRVVPTQTKELRIRIEPSRLERLLQTAAGNA